MLLRWVLPLVFVGAASGFPDPSLPTETTLTLPATVSLRDAYARLETLYPGRIQDRARISQSEQVMAGGPRSFWSVLDLMATQGKAIVRVLPDEGTIQLLPGGAGRVPSSVFGPFRLSVRRVQSSIDLETQASSHSASLEIAWEPTLLPFFVETRPKQLTLTTPQGQKRRGPDEGTAPDPVDGRFSLTFDIRLPTIPRDEKSIALLEGKLDAVVPTRMASISMPSLAQLEAAPNASAAVLAFPKDGPAGRISRIVRNKDRWSIQVVLPTPPGGEIFESYQSWVIQNEATLRLTDGKIWRSSGYLLEANTPTRSVATYHFRVQECPTIPDPATWHFHYTTPVSIVHMEIPFRLSDIPLP